MEKEKTLYGGSIKRILALILCFTMLAGCLPMLAFAEEETAQGSSMLECVYPEDDDNMFSFATQSSAVDEGGKYIITIVRSGAAEDTASVDLKTVDVSASYGKDYIISDGRYTTETTEANGTILKQVTDYDEQTKRREEFESDLSDLKSVTDSQDEETNEPGAEEPITESLNKSETNITNNGETVTDSDKSELARLKEEQTGQPTRETSSTDFTPMQELFMQSSVDEFGNSLETSSITKIEFAPSETEKQVIIEILDDSESEGNEIFDLILSNPGESYGIGTAVNCSLTINDDEPVQHSAISFSEAEFIPDGSNAKITVTRTGAEYSFCTVKVRTADGNNGFEGKDYAKVDAELTFEPYSNEYIFDIPINPGNEEKEFNLELYDFKGADEGDIIQSKVKISKAGERPETENTEAALASDDEATLASDDEKSFEINLDKKYTVKFNPGESTGRIVDTNYNPEIQVGDYYFAKDGSYGHYTGYSKADRSSYFKSGEGEGGAGYCYWYDWRTWKNGSSYFTMRADDTPLLNTRSYQYISADWRQSRSVYGGQKVVMDVCSTGGETLKMSTKSIQKKSDFSRQMSDRILFLNSNNLPIENNINIKMSAVDSESNRTPKIEFYTYGIAAMYRKFNITLLQPDNLNYRTADGKTASMAPANVSLGEGHGTRYSEQNLQIKVAETTSGEPIKGVIKKYKITTGTAKDKQVTFEYTPKGDNIQNIKFDHDFIKALDDNTKQVSVSNNTFYTDIKIQPVFDYINTEVEILSSKDGSFSDSSLSVGKHAFHVGDTIRLNGTPANENTYYIGYKEKAYKNSSDTYPDISGNMDGARDVFLDHQRYSFEPRFTAQQNHIRIELTDNAKDKLSILNKVPDSELPDSLKGGYILNTGENGYEYVPTGGKVYQVEAISKKSAESGKIYRPKFTLSSSSETINGNVMDFVAGDYPADNVVTVDVEEVNESDLTYFKVDGFATVPGNAVRSSAFNVTEAGAAGVTVIAGGIESKIFNTKTNSVMKVIDRPNSTTTDKGEFSLKGLYAKTGDRITVCLTNGDVERVEYVTLNSAGIPPAPVSYTKKVYDEEKQQTIDTPDTKDMYTMNCGSINMPIRTPLAPFVSSIKYTVDQIPDITIDTRDNAIPIVATKLYVTADINLNGREVKSVIFSKVSKNGSRQEKQVDASYKGQISFKVEYQMDTVFEDGDMLYVSLIDSEDRIISTNGTDENGNTVSTTTTEPRRYFDVFTGLTFYIPSLEVEPQTYDVNSLSSVDVPILGEMAPNLASGGLSFTKTKLDNDDPNSPYYYQFLFTPGVSNMAKQTAMTTLTTLQNSKNDAYNQLASEPENEAALMGEHINNLFAENSNETSNDVSNRINQNANKKSLANMSKGIKFDVHLTILLSFYFSYVPNEDGSSGEYMMTSGQYCIGAYAGIAKLFYWTVYGVPMYVKLSGNVELDFSGNYTTENTQNITETDFKYVKNLNDLLNPQNYIMLGLGAQVMVGVGICGVLSVRGIVSVDFIFRFKYGASTEEYMDGFLFQLGGGFGIDLFIFSFDYVPSLVTYGTGVYKDVKPDIASLESDGQDGEISIRPLSRGSSDHNNFGNSDIVTLADNANAPGYQILSENTAERAKPQLIMLDNGKKILFFLDNDPNRATLDSRCLYYSICGDNGVWSKPEKVDDNGTSDSLPTAIKSGNKVIVTWSDANQAYGDNGEPKDVLAGLEMAYIVYDSETETFSEKTVLTNDNFMDSAGSFGYSENAGKGFCYYVKRDINRADADTDLIDVSATYTTMAYRIYDNISDTWGDEMYLDIPCEGITDPLILDFDSELAQYGENDYALITYTIDKDQNITTVDDRDIYLMITNLTEKKSYYPIQLTNNYHSEVSPKLTTFDGEIYLSWISDASDFCMINITEAINTIEENGKMDIYQSADTNSPSWYKLSAEQLGMSEDEYAETLFDRLANSRFTGDPTNFSEDEYIDMNIGSYQLYNNNNEAMYLLWLDNGTGEKGDTSQELYGATFEKNVSEDSETDEKYSGWSDAVKITNFGNVIDEFSAVFGSNQEMFLCANMFDQKIGEDRTVEFSQNDLIMFDLPRTSSLNLAEGIDFEDTPIPGDETNITFTLENKGMITSGGYNLTVKQIQNGTEEVICYLSDEPIIAGDEATYLIPWSVPESIDGIEIKIEVSEDGFADEPITETCPVPREAKLILSGTSSDYTDGTAYVTTTLTNSGNLTTEKAYIVASAKDGENGEPGKEYGSVSVEPIAPGESITITYPLTNFSFDDLDEYGNAEIFQDVECGSITNGSTLKSDSSILHQREIADITFDCESTIEITAGESKQITGAVQPANTADKELIYTTSDNTIANVTTTGLVTAIANGTVQITAINPESGFKKSIDVTVTGGAQPTPTRRPSNGGSGGSAWNPTSSPVPTPETTQTPGNEWINPFTDVKETDWFYNGIKYVSQNKLFNGTGDTTFEPDSNITRGMFVTVLGRADNAESESSSPFSDVNTNEYYAPYVSWAAENGIVSGYEDGTFRPDNNITREEMAEIFMNYYDYKGEGLTGDWAIQLTYSDISDISGWAVDGIMFCTIKGLIQGKENNMFDPQGNATRAETAVIMMRAGM